MSQHTYSVASDTANAAVNIDSLTLEISQSSITVALDYINVGGDVLDIFFKAALDAGEITTLTSIVNSHAGNSIVSPSLVKIDPGDVSANGIYKAQGIVVSITATGETIVDTSLPYDVSLVSGKFLTEPACNRDSVQVIVAPGTPYEIVFVDIPSIVAGQGETVFGNTLKGFFPLTAGTVLRLKYTTADVSPDKRLLGILEYYY